MGESISQNDFNLDMELYISERKKPGDFKEKKKEKIHEAKHDDEDFKKEEQDYYSKKKSVTSRFVDFITGGESPMDAKEIKQDISEDEKELEDYSEKNGKSFFSKVKNWFSFGDDAEAAEPQEEKKNDSPKVADDVREVLKIQNKWLLRLPEKTLKEFKNSDDYKVYRDTLSKYNLIKKKE